MATIAATPEVFVRKSSGLVRVMSPSSAFIYNVLTMGLIFPWTYLWAPGALPGGQIFITEGLLRRLQRFADAGDEDIEVLKHLL